MEVELSHDITFGDCDPAGIVYYPNAFRWMDAAFHKLLREHGGHASLCEKLCAIGIGLADASVRFRRPMRDGERLTLRIVMFEWSRRSVTVHYEGAVDGAAKFSGREVRCLFIKGEGAIVAGDIEPLRQHLEPKNE